MNVLCLCGAIIGIAAALSSWGCYSQTGYFGTATLGDYLQPSHYSSSHTLLFVGGVVFVVGTIIAFLTPLSGFVQAVGLSLFAADFLDIAVNLSEAEAVLWIGFYAGGVSAIVVLASLFLPLGPGFGPASRSLRHRLLVFHRMRPLGGPFAADRMRIVRKSVLVQRKWVALLVVVMLASTVMVFHDRDFFREDEVLVPVAGGVQLYPCSPDLGLFAGGPWEQYRVSLYEGDSVVGWTFQNHGLDGGTWSALYLGTNALGDLNASLTVIDIAGDGQVLYGDSLVLTAQDGTAFADDVIYRMYWMINHTITLAWTGWEVSFVFHEGHLESWVSEVVRGGW